MGPDWAKSGIRKPPSSACYTKKQGTTIKRCRIQLIADPAFFAGRHLAPTLF